MAQTQQEARDRAAEPSEDGLTAWRTRHTERSNEWRRQRAEREHDERAAADDARSNLHVWLDWFMKDQIIPVMGDALGMFRRDIDADNKALWVTITKLQGEVDALREEVADLRQRNVTALPRKRDDAA